MNFENDTLKDPCHRDRQVLSRLTFELMRTAALTLLCSLHLLFWNQTLMTRESRPVISTSCSWSGDSRGQCRNI